MSMIGFFYALRDEDLEAIVATPSLVHRLSDDPMPPKKPSFLSRLFGGKPSTSKLEDWRPSPETTAFDVDKAWHGIHFLLTGSAWEGDGPLAFILHGGREISEDLGYGPPHGFTSAEVKTIDGALQNIAPATLFERADPQDFAKHEIYPEVWTRESKESCIGYVIEYLNALKKFVGDVAQSRRGLVIYIE